jgi:flagella basal body P-ring formation protein FlgA
MKKSTFVLLLAASFPSYGNDVAGQIKLMVERDNGAAQRVEVTVGALNSRMQLAPCAQMEPFIPSGARLWGRTTLGVRCVAGATWQAFLPVQIRVYGLAPVAARPLAAGESVTEADIRHEEVEVSLYPAGAVADLSLVAGKTLVRPVNPGQALLTSWFRARQVIAQGDMVKVVYSGPGFNVTAEGKALNHAGDGQPVRVSMESGRTITGTARPDRVVELKH